jgi:chemotaxis protein CheX
MPQSFSLSYNELSGMMEASMKDVFSMMMKSSVKQHAIEQEGPLREKIDDVFGPNEQLVVSNIGFGGEVFGYVYVYLKPQTAAFLAGKMLSNTTVGEDVDHEMINDAVGEFTNISIGGFKNQLSYMGYPCDLTIPSILRGIGISVETVSGCSRTIFHFKTRGQSILAVSIIKNENL